MLQETWTYSSTAASRGPRVNCLVRGATASFSRGATRGSDGGGMYLDVCRRRLRARAHDSVTVRCWMVGLASFTGARLFAMSSISSTCHRVPSSEVGLPHTDYAPCGPSPSRYSSEGARELVTVLKRLTGSRRKGKRLPLVSFLPTLNLLFCCLCAHTLRSNSV
jgi:hypothetical protein